MQPLGAVAATACTDDASIIGIIGLSPLNWAIVLASFPAPSARTRMTFDRTRIDSCAVKGHTHACTRGERGYYCLAVADLENFVGVGATFAGRLQLLVT